MEGADNFLYKELSYEIIGCAYDAFKTVGIGFDEIRYHKIFHHYLFKKGLKADYKKIKILEYSGERIAEFEMDEIVEDKIIVELKCIQSNFIPENIAQIMTYLKVMDYRLGILMNFGLSQAKPKRIIFEQQIAPNTEDWDESFFNDVSVKKRIDQIFFSLHNVHNTLGGSYNSKIYEKAMQIELKQNKILFNDKTCVNTKIGNFQFSPFKLDYWLIEESILLGILSGSGKPHGYDLLRMRNYLKKLNLHHGLIAFWSNKNLQLYGIYEL